jgi:hypothetical protein
VEKPVPFQLDGSIGAITPSKFSEYGNAAICAKMDVV